MNQDNQTAAVNNAHVNYEEERDSFIFALETQNRLLQKEKEKNARLKKALQAALDA